MNTNDGRRIFFQPQPVFGAAWFERHTRELIPDDWPNMMALRLTGYQVAWRRSLPGKLEEGLVDVKDIDTLFSSATLKAPAIVSFLADSKASRQEMLSALVLIGSAAKSRKVAVQLDCTGLLFRLSAKRWAFSDRSIKPSSP